MLRVVKIDSLERLQAIKPIWDRLLRACPHGTPFLTYEWTTNWWKHFARRKELCVLVLYDDWRPVLIAPLMKYIGRVHDRYAPFPAVTIASIANYHSNRADFVFADLRAEYMQAIWEFVLAEERWHMLKLYPLLETAPTVCALKQLIGLAGLPAVFTHSQTSPYLTLPGHAEDFEKCVPKQVARQIRRVERESCRLDVVHVTTSTEVETAMRDVFDISENGWAARTGTAISSTSALRGFYRDLAEIAAKKGWLYLSILRLDGKKIAFEYNLVYESTLYNLKLAFDPAYARFSPGQLLKHAMLSHVLKCMPGIGEYDMLGDADPYKLMWTPRARRHLKAYVFNPRSVYARFLYGIQSALLHHPSVRNKVIWKPGYETPGEEVFKKA